MKIKRSHLRLPAAAAPCLLLLAAAAAAGACRHADGFLDMSGGRCFNARRTW